MMLREKTRKCDLICRYGGEEFAIILPETTLEGAQTDQPVNFDDAAGGGSNLLVTLGSGSREIDRRTRRHRPPQT